jgi:hypothetical protein
MPNQKLLGCSFGRLSKSVQSVCHTGINVMVDTSINSSYSFSGAACVTTSVRTGADFSVRAAAFSAPR